MIKAEIGVIGGSGLYDIPGMKKVESVTVSTPFGDPSDAITILDIGGILVAFLPRHGRGHRVNPSYVNSRANIYAFKHLGVSRIISVSAVGSLREDIHPRDFVIPDQIIDRTRSRVNSFFEPYAVHVNFADPVCGELSSLISETGKTLGLTVHPGGTYVCMEGPLFSTKAESALHRSWGASIIGMTALPEAKLAREAEICYAIISLVTDYDVWKENETVKIESVLQNIRANTQKVRELLVRVIPRISRERHCACATALNNAIITDPDRIPGDTKQQWKLLISKYIPVD
ncbi:S-methyl-5'-thioadenosine phosphorylase [bacterium]|nr:S-methyl-5'-thioadenosine phosphorylase [candidate division CSSED10-310 bacterium]